MQIQVSATEHAIWQDATAGARSRGARNFDEEEEGFLVLGV